MIITVKNIYWEICKVTTEEERAHWQSDFYCKVTPQTTEIINNYEFKCNVQTFIDQITHTCWYDIPFVYPFREL